MTSHSRAGSPSTRSRRRATTTAALLAACLVTAAGCDGPQSALDPAGRGADVLASLFWWMVGGAAVVWTVVIGLGVYSLWIHPRPHHRRLSAFLIIGGGAVFPVVVLAGLLAYGLSLLPDLLEPAPEGSLRITVSGEQWWWRVRYEPPGGEPFDLANEIRLPVNEPVEFRLESPDVIHAFWIPPLGGKVDMIPGRVTRLTLLPTRTGGFRGVCAEYCGDSHALMAFPVVVTDADDFAQWMDQQAAPAQEPDEPSAVRGRDIFVTHGCGACHTIRGTTADGRVGPDLTHVGSRLSLGAGTLGSAPDDFVRWIAQTEEVKPGAHMPEFGMLRPDDLRDLATYLDSLE